MSLSIMLISRKCFPKSQSISSLGASKRPKKVYKSCCCALSKKLEVRLCGSACNEANTQRVSLFRDSLQPPGVTHRMFRCGHVWADFESLSCTGQCLLMSIYEQRGWRLFAVRVSLEIQERHRDMASRGLPLRPWFQRKRADRGGFDRIYWRGYSIVVYRCL